jgi:hypothetical protein
MLRDLDGRKIMGQTNPITRLLGLSRPETMPEAALDETTDVVALPMEPDELAAAEPPTPLDGAASDTLEEGIAEIFAEIRAGDADPAEHEPPDDAITFALLGELNRIWQSPAA